MTISFFFLSETLTMILCKMSLDTEGSYQQTFCRNLSRAYYCNLYNVAIPFHRPSVLSDQNTHGRQQGLPAAKHRSDRDSRLRGLRVFSVPLRTEWCPQVTEVGISAMLLSLPATADITQQGRGSYLFGFSESSVSNLASVMSPCWHFTLFK